MNYVDNPRQYRMFSSIAIIALIVAVLVVFAVSPLLGNLRDMKENITQSKVELNRITAEIVSYEQLSAQISQVSVHEQEILKMFPVREETANLVEGLEESIERATAAHTLTITDKKELALQPGGLPKGKPEEILLPTLKQIEEVPYNLEVLGGFRQLTDFLLYLEHQPYFTEFRRLTVTADQVQREVPGQKPELINTGTATAKFEGVYFIQP